MTHNCKMMMMDIPFVLEFVLASGSRSPSSSCFMADRRGWGSAEVRFGVEADML